MSITELPADYALVLQQLQEDGEEDLATLAESLHLERSRVSHIVQALHHKGLLVISWSGHREAWLRLSAKGRRLLLYLWPESGLHPRSV